MPNRKGLTGETKPQHAKLEAVLDAMGLEFAVRRKRDAEQDMR